MEYNKNQFVKANDHKILHKVKKQWIVLSMSMLALLGGGVVAEHVSAHADTANNDQGQSTLKDRLNQNLSQTRQQPTLVQSPAEAQSVRNNTYNGHQLSNNGQIHSTSQNITNQANVLHNRILRNANEQAVNVSKNEVSQRRSNVGIYSKALTNAPSNALAGPSPLSSSKTVNEIIKFNYVDGNPNNDQNSDIENGTPGTRGTVSVPRPGNYVFSDAHTSHSFTYSNNVNTPGTIILDVYKPDIVDFVLSGNNIPNNYKGPVGVISSDDQDYYQKKNKYTFSDNARNVKGLPVNYHIAGNQEIPYDGFIHRVQIAPNEETGYINYVYTDRKGNHHLVKQVTLFNDPHNGSNDMRSDFYGVQFHVNGKNGIGDEKDEYDENTNPTGVTSSDQIQGTGNYSGKEYRLVNRNPSDNKFIFDDGTLLNGKSQSDGSKQNNPSDTTKPYNPSNNVFTVPVEPVSASNIDIEYINETGQQIASDYFSGTYGQTLDHASAINNKNYAISNYRKQSGNGDLIVSDNPDPKDYKVDLTNSDLSYIYSTYHFTDNPQVITVPLKGNQTSNFTNPIKVNVKLNDVNGIHQHQVNLSGQIGNFVTLYPSDLLKGKGHKYPDDALSDYVVDSNYPDSNYGDNDPTKDWNTKPVTYYIKGNNNGTATLFNVSDASQDTPNDMIVNNQQVNPHYKPSKNQATPPTFTYLDEKPGTITLHYRNVKTNSDDGSDTITPNASDYGKSINVINPNSSLHPASKDEAGTTATGKQVPDGYALADVNMPNTIYTVNGYKQNITLYVRKLNNQEVVTNGSNNSYPLKIYQIEQLYINGTKNTTKNSDGWKNGQRIVLDTSDHISNVPGGMSKLMASDTVPEVNGDHVTPQSDAGYQLKFGTGTPGSLTISDYNNEKGLSVNPNPTETISSANADPTNVDPTKMVVFHYRVDQTVPESHNYIHYISSSDIDNNADITKTFNDSDFLTTIDKTGSDKQGFNDKYYRENVPQGFQFDKVWKVESDDSGGHLHTVANPSQGLTHYGTTNQDEYIEVIPNASNISVHYVDQNGRQIAQHIFNASDKSQISSKGYSSKFGQFIPEIGTESIEHNKDFHPVGHNKDFSQSTFNYKLVAQPYHTADGSVNHNSIFMFGRQPQDVKVTVVGQSDAKTPITVKYINQAGDLVGYQSFYGRLGDNVNVLGDNKQNVPKGYQLVGNDQPTTYNFENNPYTVYLNVKGQSVTHKLTIEKVMKQSDGMTKVSDGTSDTLSGSDGSVTEVNPNAYTPNGYTPDYSKDSVQFITLNQNQKLMPNKVVFYYDDKTTNGAPITIRYVNQTGDQVGSQILNGNVGTQTKDASDLFNSQANLKNSYSLNMNMNKSTKYTFTDSPQTDVINVKGDSNLTPFDLKIITENADGSKAKVSDKKIPVGNQVGDHFDISPYNVKYIPTGGFHPTESDSDISITVEANGQLSPVNSAAFIYQNDSGQANEGIWTVRVHYVTELPSGINTAGKSNSGEIDEESDQGYVGQDTFDATPYLHDIPESVLQFYDIPAGEQAVDSNGHSILNDSWKFNSGGVKDIYIKVNPINGPIIID